MSRGAATHNRIPIAAAYGAAAIFCPPGLLVESRSEWLTEVSAEVFKCHEHQAVARAVDKDARMIHINRK